MFRLKRIILAAGNLGGRYPGRAMVANPVTEVTMQRTVGESGKRKAVVIRGLRDLYNNGGVDEL